MKLELKPVQLKQVRLLPVVIFAAAALLLFKGVGLVTNGGYVIVGTTEAQAAGGGKPAAAAEGGHGAPAADGDATMALPSDPTLEDVAPTLEDKDPTLGAKASAGGHGAPATGGHGETAAEGEEVGHGEEAAAGHGEPAAAGDHGEAEKPADHAEAEAPAADHGDKPAAEHGDVAKEEGCVAPADGHGEPVCPVAEEPKGDAVAMERDASGNLVPIADVTGTGSETQILERLRERRTELDSREAELELRLSLVEAAEKRIDERTAALQALEKRIETMVEEKKSIEEEQFTAVVAMYQTMKPKEAAAIFDQLELTLLLRVARAISPRKMAPILAKMDPRRAQELTSAMAVDKVEPTIDLVGEDLSKLPQIIGQ